jgi:hypothetical protein
MGTTLFFSDPESSRPRRQPRPVEFPVIEQWRKEREQKLRRLAERHALKADRGPADFKVTVNLALSVRARADHLYRLERSAWARLMKRLLELPAPPG